MLDKFSNEISMEAKLPVDKFSLTDRTVITGTTCFQIISKILERVQDTILRIRMQLARANSLIIDPGKHSAPMPKQNVKARRMFQWNGRCSLESAIAAEYTWTSTRRISQLVGIWKANVETKFLAALIEQR